MPAGDTFCVRGLGTLWGIFPSGNWPGDFERFSPWSFRGLAGSDVRLCLNHDRAREVAGTSDGSLDAWADGRGLRFRATVRRAGHGLALWEACQAGRVTGCSLGWGRLGPPSRNRTAVRTVRHPAPGVPRGVLHKHTQTHLEEVSILLSPMLPACAGTAQYFTFRQ